MRNGRPLRNPVTPTQVARPAVGRRRLSEGTLAQASIRARLLGIPLLRLDATVALAPAAISVSSPALLAGENLADAVRSINEGANVLAELRRDSRC